MSVQFGRLNFEGAPVVAEYLEKVRKLLVPYGPDGVSSYSKSGVGMFYGAFHTTKESCREIQPHITRSHQVLIWDGRLDNRSELIHALRADLSNESTDLSIVAVAYEDWGSDSFAKLKGDWALSIWNPAERSLTLAKDPIGTHPLYYSIDANQITWSSILDPLVLFARKTFTLCEEYIAGWFSYFPDAHLTPYLGIQSVPPSSFVLLRPGKHTVNKYWDFDPGKRIRYRTDRQYEEHFRAVFAEAVNNRLRSNGPVLAELSGGIDSSSIVCMADTVIAQGATGCPRLDTVSFYNDSEPNWDEQPYFTRVEEKRGRRGCHIDAGSRGFLALEFEKERFAATPDSLARPDGAARELSAYMNSLGSRVVLSGIGGDEVMGGVPTPTPELQDFLARGRFGALAHQLKIWALVKRKPWLHLLLEALRGFFPPTLVGVPERMRPTPWLRADFEKRYRFALTGYESRLRLLGPLPAFQQNLSTLNLLRRQLGCSALSCDPPYLKRYPYLDRGLLEFMYAIPREQVVRPGQRRSLMRRALVGIVPDELLNRKRKAYIARTPIAAISTEWASIVGITQEMVAGALGIVNAEDFRKALQMARQGQEISLVILIRTLAIEFWLRSLGEQGVLPSNPTLNKQITSLVDTAGASTDSH